MTKEQIIKKLENDEICGDVMRTGALINCTLCQSELNPDFCYTDGEQGNLCFDCAVEAAYQGQGGTDSPEKEPEPAVEAVVHPLVLQTDFGYTVTCENCGESQDYALTLDELKEFTDEDALLSDLQDDWDLCACRKEF